MPAATAGIDSVFGLSCGPRKRDEEREKTLSRNPVVRRLLDHLHVMHMALAHAGAGDAHELGARAHLLHIAGARVDHRRAQAAGELMEDRHEAALVEHAAFDALWHQLLELGAAILEIAVGAAIFGGHRAERAHAAILLV